MEFKSYNFGWNLLVFRGITCVTEADAPEAPMLESMGIPRSKSLATAGKMHRGRILDQEIFPFHVVVFGQNMWKIRPY